ncbi:L-lysine 6-monooxygenase [Streptomyces corynorhini]|uniref:L-lysine N6-monooxygenase MbtG n=1 Tax=Streptomyces corynorhini TaxID=2282652 RepID=A0A370BDI4_9ACTN|nr:L-lysine 6-monooxygenase [Streptomyces corynorhini]
MYSPSASEGDEAPLDVLGVGFGPSNLSLAIALGEQERPRPRVHFYERHPRFSWHGDMLLKDATMQVHFLKDLVTLRNPGSPYTFLSYLHSRERLVDFINHKVLFPSRVEFHDYLEWAANAYSDRVSYGCEVSRVEPVWADSGLRHVNVHLTPSGPDGPRHVVRQARNVVLAPGLRPHLPEGAEESERVWHSSRLLTRLEGIPRDEPVTFTVVGAGQSAAEVTAYLHGRFPGALVRAVFSHYGYNPADDSPFANRIFDPTAVDEFFESSHTVRQMLIDRHGSTNYSVVDQDLIEELYRIWYQEKVTDDRRLLIDNVSRILEVEETSGRLSLTLESLTTREKRSVASDYLVYATGYRPAPPESIIAPEIMKLCKRDSSGRLRVDRDYRIRTEEGVHCGFYLQGATEHTHGLSSTLLSNIAVRAGEIASSLLARG